MDKGYAYRIQEEMQMANKHVNWCSTSLVLRKIQIKIRRILFHPAKNNTWAWEKCPEKGSSRLGLMCHGSKHVLQKGWRTWIWGNYRTCAAGELPGGQQEPVHPTVNTSPTGRCWQVFVRRTGLHIRSAEAKGSESELLSEACTSSFLLLEAAPRSEPAESCGRLGCTSSEFTPT